MNTVSGSSSYSTRASASKGMSGLVSGLDTDAMVESMLSGTQNKIDKQYADKQVTMWKQLMYRDIISQINLFQSTFFGKTSSSNLMSADFFNSMSAITASKAFSAIATTQAAAGKTSVQVGQLATASRVQSGAAVSGALTGSLDTTALERRVVLKTGTEEIELQLDSIPTTKPDGTAMTEAERLDSLAAQLNTKLSGKGITASIKAGKLDFSGTDFTVSAKSSKLGMDMLGVVAGSKTTDGTLATYAKVDANVSFTMNLNGISKTISLDGVTKSSDLTKELQTRIDNAFGKGWVTVDTSGGKFSLTTNGKGNIATISGDQTGLTLLGLQAGQSNKVNRGQMLKNINFGQSLQGGSFEFSINGVDFSFSGEQTLNDVIKTVNGSTAGVRITYSDIEDKFTIESTNTGAGFGVNMQQKQGNLLNAMFGDAGVKTGSKASSNPLTSNTLSGSTDFGVGVSEFKTGAFRFNVNGQDYSIVLPAKTDKYTRQEAMDLINEGLASRFGYVDGGSAGVADDIQAIELVGDATTGYSISVRNGAKVTFSDALDGKAYDKDILDKLAETSNLQAAFGFNNVNNKLTDTTATLASTGIKTGGQITIGSTVISYSDTDSVQSLLDKINGSGSGVTASFKDGQIALESSSDTTVKLTGDLAKTFGSSELQLGSTQGGGKAVTTEGQNAVVVVNGVTIQRSSNTFTVSGLTLSLTAETGKIQNERLTKVDNSWKDADGNLYTVNADGQLLDSSGNIAAKYSTMKIDSNGFLSTDGSLNIDGEAETITTSRNTEDIFKGLKSFVDQYNELIGKLNKLVDAEPTYKKYAPLTDAQKKEMSDKEIELWEEKAKEGLLRKDDNISSFLSSMRSILYTKPEGSDYALYNLGIDTSSEWKDKGKLILDEAKLKTMIESNPQALQELFTNAQSGLGTLLNDTITKTAGTSSGSPGTLVELAGVEGKTTAVSNTLTKRLISIDNRIKDLQAKYEKERLRYWRQFNSMETQLSNMNSQSSWLSSQFS